MHDITVRLDEGQTGSIGTASAGTHSTLRLRQMLEECTFALAGARDGQQVVTQALFRQGDRNRVTDMTGGADLPANTPGQLRWSQRRTGASAFHIGQISQVLRLG